jgi:hypothetical protein
LSAFERSRVADDASELGFYFSIVTDGIARCIKWAEPTAGVAREIRVANKIT